MKHFLKTQSPRVLVFLVVLFLLSSGVSEAKVSAPKSTTKRTTCSGWQQVPSPNPGSYTDQLNGVAAVSANDAWAVGSYSNTTGPSQTLIEQWNGTNWNVVSGSNVGDNTNVLNSVAVVSANDVWAVGSSSNTTGPSQTLIEQWDGTSWNAISSPNIGTYDNILTGVAVVSTNDIWAVGYSSDAYYLDSTLIEHWDGTSWSVVPSPYPGSPWPIHNVLSGITVVSATDVWAVGTYQISSNNKSEMLNTLTEHWDGIKWSIIPSPNHKNNVNNLYAVAAVPGTKQVWNVGSSGTDFTILTEQWNGSAWSIVPTKHSSQYQNALYGITVAGGPQDIVAVGYNQSQPDSPAFGLIEQWNGSTWNKTYNNTRGYLTGVAWVPASKKLWAVGNDVSDIPTVILSYC